MKHKRVCPGIVAILVILVAGAAAVCRADDLTAKLDAPPPGVEVLYSAGQYGHAAEALQRAIDRNPKDAFLAYWLGRCFYESHDFSRSISSLEHAIALDPGRSEYHDWLGRASGRKADESRSNMASALSLARRTHNEFQTAVRLDATNINAQRDLIAFMKSAPGNLGGGEARALEQIRALSAVDTVAGELALADLYAERKRFDQAGEQYEKVLASTSHRIGDYFEVADYYRDRSDPGRMNAAVEAAARISSSDHRLTYYRGVALVIAKKDSAVAEKDLRSYIETVPDNSEVPAHSSTHEWLGRLYENEKRPDLATAQYQAALTLDPQNKSLRDALRRLHKDR